MSRVNPSDQQLHSVLMGIDESKYQEWLIHSHDQGVLIPTEPKSQARSAVKHGNDVDRAAGYAAAQPWPHAFSCVAGMDLLRNEIFSFLVWLHRGASYAVPDTYIKTGGS